MSKAQNIAASRAKEFQCSWYGESLGSLFRRLIDDLGLKRQARLAATLGISEAMLSQLMSGRRTKIGSPVVIQRIQALQELAQQLADGGISATEATIQIARVRKYEGTSVLNPGSQNTVLEIRQVVREIQSLLLSIATAGEIVAAAELLSPAHPKLAEFIRIYGVEDAADGVDHYESHTN
ncbi:DNA-binding protein [Streptomyces sp. NPDC056480]|uniref:DNA-binding protein n=1 Tax=Streptomyces sp. NPDC056480 TaxID=3345833 RepID=UPI0036C2ED81